MPRTRDTRHHIMMELDGEQARSLLVEGRKFDVVGVDFVCEALPSAATAEDDRTTTWVRAYPAEQEETVLGAIAPWELAHHVRQSSFVRSLQPRNIEPASVPGPDTFFDPVEIRARIHEASTCSYQGQNDDWPMGPGFAWHLGQDFTQLKLARERAGFGSGIRIAHIDTGYDPDHVTRPINLREELGWNFYSNRRDTVDRYPYAPPISFGGHGTGTLALLAGNRVKVGSFDDYLGGAPLADVVPLVASPSVIANPGDPEEFVQAVDRAITLQCNVISMSCGGLPWIRMAQAAERAYNAGVVFVAAAGNYYCLVPAIIVCPALFTTTIAAGGGMADHRHYGKSWPDCMTKYGACYEPAELRGTLVSGYTPNAPWAVRGCNALVSHNGDGTSSSTPQVAAAAALWLSVHGRNYPPDGRRVEACLRALRATAFPGPGPYGDRMGAGLIRANEALNVTPAIEDLKLGELPGRVLCPQAQSLPGYGDLEPLERNMLECELAQVLYRVPVSGALTNNDVRSILQQPGLSTTLRLLLVGALVAEPVS